MNYFISAVCFRLVIFEIVLLNLRSESFIYFFKFNIFTFLFKILNSKILKLYTQQKYKNDERFSNPIERRAVRQGPRGEGHVIEHVIVVELESPNRGGQYHQPQPQHHENNN